MSRRISTAAILAIELDGFGALLKADHDAEIAGRPAAERNGFLEMIADRRPPGVVRDRDVARGNRAPRLLSAGAARGASGSDGGAAARVIEPGNSWRRSN